MNSPGSSLASGSHCIQPRGAQGEPQSQRMVRVPSSQGHRCWPTRGPCSPQDPRLPSAFPLPFRPRAGNSSQGPLSRISAWSSHTHSSAHAGWACPPRVCSHRATEGESASESAHTGHQD